MKQAKYLLLLLMTTLVFTNVNAQEDEPLLPYKVAPQNLLKFNRFLINPTFSTVQEDKSYINFFHRNQSVQFNNNDQTYFVSYSGRVGDRNGLGLSLYSQKKGLVSNIGVLANYAYGLKLSDKSNFTFGANLAYYNTGYNQNSANPIDLSDPLLYGADDSNVLSFQPGFNLSYGRFDFGAFAENLLDYNLKTSKQLTDFTDKTYSAHLQYTHPFSNNTGIMQGARLMPLARVRLNAQNGQTTATEQELTYGGGMILDLPKLGWLQGGYDSFYGASAGAGFNLNKRLSLGYNMEKGFGTDFNNLGVTHEISFAYSFTPNLTEDRVMLEDNEDELVEEELATDDLATNEEIEKLKKKLAENDEIIAELMFRQDSLEANRQKDLERRFNMVMKMVRNETNGNRPDLEKRAQDMFLTGNDNAKIAQNNSGNDGYIPNSTNTTRNNNSGPNYTNDVTQKRDALNTTNSVVGQDGKIVKSRKFRDLEGVTDGYYVVANVYKGGQYMDKFMNNLSNKGLNPDYIDNPNNGLKYVYLERYDTWEDALAAHQSQMNGEYSGDLWIMNVDNKYSNEAYATNVDKLDEKADKYGNDVLQQNVIVQDKLSGVEPETQSYDLDGVGSGYYIIANVFSSPKNAKRFVKILNSYGLSAGYFINPENNWRYVYLKKHETWNNALISYYSKINDSYDDKMWIMRVTPNLIT
ncbi:type IX secretion system membrane protein PorP/SprF [Kriegella sp. EG-1]|nr:type IX secretion system membrane protein PorP/SprF [Flavobacteriaceae bacterium EG-1]